MEAAVQEATISQRNDKFSCIRLPIFCDGHHRQKSRKMKMHNSCTKTRNISRFGADVTSAEPSESNGDWFKIRNKAEAPAPTLSSS